ncbi:MAG TPA: DUF4382 domain-containing protein [Candidatus Elarobacter sp.]|jgi:hypothetical protein
MKAALFLAALTLAACSTPGSSLNAIPSESGSSVAKTPSVLLGGPPLVRLNVALFDAPLAGMNGVKVNIGIDGVQLVASNGTAVPFVSNQQPDVVNLLDLQNHSENFNGKAPAGSYSVVRVLIDRTSSNVTIGNFTIPIIWGTAAKPLTASVIAVDFPCNFTLLAVNGRPPTVTLDFNVLHSVRFANGRIYVQPTVVAANNAAQVSGSVLNRAGKPVTTAAVLAVDMLGHVVNSTVTASDGSYTIHALPAGIYTIQVKNSYVTAQGDTVTASGADAGAAPSTPAVLAPNDDLDLPTLVD